MFKKNVQALYSIVPKELDYLEAQLCVHYLPNDHAYPAHAHPCVGKVCGENKAHGLSFTRKVAAPNLSCLGL